ncbi:hypothetical protein O181_000692 [Austropuccinia psidii MF-1]|uniref:CCHC-type domain-containing protein n=1 Tax=Austropuccinia psidii MF-1 TaxID=1389203 RepID=A0A9Q3GCB1_9BASI|nr:hypothetical protein [Austropuccinia psidii MF-1]
MREEHEKHDWSWWKSEIITKSANNFWRLIMENDFESTILNSEKDKPLTWFLKRKYRLCSLHLEISDPMINMKILRKCGGELENAIKCRFVEPCSKEDYINAMEDIITRTRIRETLTRNPMESKVVPKTSRQERRPEIPVLKCHKCGSTSHFANTCKKIPKSMKFNSLERFSVMERKQNLTKIVKSLRRTQQQRIMLFKTLQLSLKSPNSILTCHSAVRIVIP